MLSTYLIMKSKIILFLIVNLQIIAPDLHVALTAGSSKSWYLRNSSEVSTASCNSNGVSVDNIYVFSSNGIFTFDHGTILEDPNCAGDDCCTDLVNITGKWKFTSNQTRLVITALTETGNPSNVLNVVLFDAVIDQLDENVLIFTQTHPTTGEKRTFEFHKK